MFEFTRFFNLTSKLEYLYHTNGIISVSKRSDPRYYKLSQMNSLYSCRYTTGFKLILNPTNNSLSYTTMDYIFSSTTENIKFLDFEARDYDDTELLMILGKKYTDDNIYRILKITQTHEYQIKSFIKGFNENV